MTEQLEILMTDEDRNFPLDIQSLRCSCGRRPLLQRARAGTSVQFKVHCETSELYRQICQMHGKDPDPCPDTGWHPSSRIALQVWKAITVLSKLS